MRCSDLMVNNKKVDFAELLQESDLPTAVRMMITILKRQTMQIFQQESEICQLNDSKQHLELWRAGII